MRTEKNYEFRKRLDIVHKPGIFDRSKQPQADEIILDGSWEIVYDGLPQKGCAALDLQDYLQVCMGIGIPVVKESSGGKAIILKEELADKGFDLAVTQEKITISGNVRKGVHHLEDVMNLRDAPYLPVKTMRSDPIFTPRMVHSGWALDCFPDSHLNAISHAGFDAILLFVTGPNKTSHGYLDFNDLIDRAEAYGLGVYFYSYLNSFKRAAFQGGSDSEAGAVLVHPHRVLPPEMAENGTCQTECLQEYHVPQYFCGRKQYDARRAGRRPRFRSHYDRKPDVQRKEDQVVRRTVRDLYRPEPQGSCHFEVTGTSSTL